MRMKKNRSLIIIWENGDIESFYGDEEGAKKYAEKRMKEKSCSYRIV